MKVTSNIRKDLEHYPAINIAATISDKITNITQN